jgi:hypothetical protein
MVVEVRRDVEFAAFDELGPKTQAVLRAANWSAYEVLMGFQQRGLDPVRNDLKISRLIEKMGTRNEPRSG